MRRLSKACAAKFPQCKLLSSNSLGMHTADLKVSCPANVAEKGQVATKIVKCPYSNPPEISRGDAAAAKRYSTLGPRSLA